MIPLSSKCCLGIRQTQDQDLEEEEEEQEVEGKNSLLEGCQDTDNEEEEEFGSDSSSNMVYELNNEYEFHD